MLGSAALAGGAGYGLYRVLRNRKKPQQGMNADSFGAPVAYGKSAKGYTSRAQQKRLTGPSNIVDAEWSEVPTAITDQRKPAQLEQQPMPATRKEVAARKARNAAEGSTNTNPIRMRQPVKEPLDAGLARTLNGGVESEVVKMLRSNPGLARTLARVLP
jgi:hypothetical protein